jgi:hypothetical protein
MKKCLLFLMPLVLLLGCAEEIVSSMKKGTEVGMLADMRNMHVAQTQFMMKNQRYGTLAELRSANLIDEALASGEKNGYKIAVLSADDKSYAIQADPNSEDTLNLRHFYIDQTGVMRANDSKPAGPHDPPAVM